MLTHGRSCLGDRLAELTYAATLLSAYALRLGLACGYGRRLGVVFCSLTADLFWTAVFVFEHGKFPYL